MCRTDLHITMGELKPLREVGDSGTPDCGACGAAGAGRWTGFWREGERVGVSWLGGVDGTCSLCRKGQENLCDNPVFTGYTVNGGYAEYAVARADFLVPLPEETEGGGAWLRCCARGLSDFAACGWRACSAGDRVGLFGFGASAHLTIDVLRHWGCEVYVSTRGESHRKLAAGARGDVGGRCGWTSLRWRWTAR